MNPASIPNVQFPVYFHCFDDNKSMKTCKSFKFWYLCIDIINLRTVDYEIQENLNVI